MVFSHNPICGGGDWIEITSGADNTLPGAVYDIVNFFRGALFLKVEPSDLPAKCFQLLLVY